MYKDSREVWWREVCRNRVVARDIEGQASYCSTLYALEPKLNPASEFVCAVQ